MQSFILKNTNSIKMWCIFNEANIFLTLDLVDMLLYPSNEQFLWRDDYATRWVRDSSRRVHLVERGISIAVSGESTVRLCFVGSGRRSIVGATLSTLQMTTMFMNKHKSEKQVLHIDCWSISCSPPLWRALEYTVDICKFELPQKSKSRAQSADSSSAYRKPRDLSLLQLTLSPSIRSHVHDENYPVRKYNYSDICTSFNML